MTEHHSGRTGHQIYTDSPGPLDLTAGIIAFETGELELESVVSLFVGLLNTGMITQLQGAYQRTAERLIQAGAITQSPDQRRWIAGEIDEL